jgi:hypothetical protein
MRLCAAIWRKSGSSLTIRGDVSQIKRRPDIVEA